MTKDSFQSTFLDRLAISPEVCAMLGKTPEQIAHMDLREFADLVYSKGYEVTCSAWETRAGNEGKLTITTDRASSAEVA